jgi:hypothetical protein
MRYMKKQMMKKKYLEDNSSIVIAQIVADISLKNRIRKMLLLLEKMMQLDN